MTIRHQSKILTTSTEYNDNHLTRVIDSRIHTIDLKTHNSIKDLERLSALDNESFALMADLQRPNKETK